MNWRASGESYLKMEKLNAILLVRFFVFVFLYVWGASGAVLNDKVLLKDKDVVFIQSRSGQFFASAKKNVAGSSLSEYSTNLPKTVEIDPNFLVVVSERIKDRFLFSLNLEDRWKGRIFLTIFPARSHFDPIFVNAQHTDAGWMYYVDLPSRIQINRLIRAMVEVLLQELADRSAGSKPAELPPWLAPAIAFQMQFDAPDISIMEPFSKRVRVDKRRNPFDLIRSHFRTERPLSWEELCWPGDEDLLDYSITNRYSMCSFLFFSHLMRLPEANAGLRKFFTISPSYWNWQVAFVKAFEPQFYSMRDVEKWWAVTLAGYIGVSQFKTLTPEETISQLDDILDSPVKAPAETNQPPIIERILLQSIILNYKINQHKQLIRQKIADLTALRHRAYPSFVGLIDDYRTALENYLRRRVAAGYEPDLPRLPRENPKTIVQQTVQRLDELDFIRSDLRLYGVDELQIELPFLQEESAREASVESGRIPVAKPQTNSLPAKGIIKPRK
ncbi:MAG: hypothetical protein N2487_04510 [Verrucomicrobiae bacterium]|nr:hypothetical protein [Verrucomicrobiae bacterium]